MDSLRVEYLLGRIKHHFKLINKCQDFTEADKAQLKTFYLEHFVAPDARRIMEKSLSEAFVRQGRKLQISPKNPYPPRPLTRGLSFCITAYRPVDIRSVARMLVPKKVRHWR